MASLKDELYMGNSLLHQLDPRVKLVSCTLFSIVMAICSTWQGLVLGLGLALTWTVLARLPIKHVLARLIMVNGLIAILWLILPFAVRGQALFSVGPFTATKQGLLYTLHITMRSNAIVLALLSLLATSSLFSLGHAMGKLGIPGKIVQLLLFAYRYIHVIQLEYRRLSNAIKIRGFQPKTNLHTYKTYAYLIGMLLVKSYDRAERIRQAMICRGFCGRYYDLSEYRLKPRDMVLGICMIFGTLLIAWIEWTTWTRSFI
ncbi:MAG: cobalt ECF transporter T component CbiQ [Deltaproteobacteria bacterium]|nr:cobalt ECF transporter T component CbiQ [Deltaproteobacteria bacterium]MBW1927713.1 cobalt ECF transporter T component CbiQ [Deltaproteobacteria bacterium]MBW2025104.1 cobalt ECF transporter T component CbiQ [Deltaproteobacteria bacterium]